MGGCQDEKRQRSHSSESSNSKGRFMQRLTYFRLTGTVCRLIEGLDHQRVLLPAFIQHSNA